VSDNRRATRHHVSIAAKINVDGSTVEATLLNLSIGGASVSSAGKHAMGQRVTVSFRVSTSEHTIEIGAIVRWVDSNGIGLQFDGLRARDVWALNEFFKRLP
jgi:hypothetical protein